MLVNQPSRAWHQFHNVLSYCTRKLPEQWIFTRMTLCLKSPTGRVWGCNGQGSWAAKRVAKRNKQPRAWEIMAMPLGEWSIMLSQTAQSIHRQALCIGRFKIITLWVQFDRLLCLRGYYEMFICIPYRLWSRYDRARVPPKRGWPFVLTADESPMLLPTSHSWRNQTPGIIVFEFNISHMLMLLCTWQYFSLYIN